MQTFLKLVNGRTKDLELESKDTIAEVKQKVACLTNAHPSHQRLVLVNAENGPIELLDDTKTVADYMIQKEADIQLVVRPVARIVSLNIGGITHLSLLSTLCRVKGSRLERMFDGLQNGAAADLEGTPNDMSTEFVPTLPDRSYFIDRNGALFSFILDYLRDCSPAPASADEDAAAPEPEPEEEHADRAPNGITLPTSTADLLQLSKEADFFELPELAAACRRALTPGIVPPAPAPADAAPEEPQGWQSLGTLHSFVLEVMIDRYPFAAYEWGATYNTINIAPIVINGWNRGVRVFFSDPYLQQDNGGALKLGSAMMTRGTDDDETAAKRKADGTPEFQHFYVRADGRSYHGRNTSSFGIYVRPLQTPWEDVGQCTTQEDFDRLRAEYPARNYQWGTDYNGFSIKPLTITKWNRGWRVHVTKPYIQGDRVGTDTVLGTAVWTRGTDDAESKGGDGAFYHRYYQMNDGGELVATQWGNGACGFKLFVRRT